MLKCDQNFVDNEVKKQDSQKLCLKDHILHRKVTESKTNIITHEFIELIKFLPLLAIIKNIYLKIGYSGLRNFLKSTFKFKVNLF